MFYILYWRQKITTRLRKVGTMWTPSSTMSWFCLWRAEERNNMSIYISRQIFFQRDCIHSFCEDFLYIYIFFYIYKKGEERSLREKLENSDEMRRKSRNPCWRNENFIIISYHLELCLKGGSKIIFDQFSDHFHAISGYFELLWFFKNCWQQFLYAPKKFWGRG